MLKKSFKQFVLLSHTKIAIMYNRNLMMKKEFIVASESLPRSLAIEHGESTYITGKVCKNGHNAPRYTINSNCCVCHKARIYAKREQLRRTKNKTTKDV